METNEIYAVRLEKKGVKPTAVRILVLKAMLESPCALSLIELETLLGTVDRSTIFRTLNHFLAHHVVHDIEDGSGSLKYESVPTKTLVPSTTCTRISTAKSVTVPSAFRPSTFPLSTCPKASVCTASTTW
mgnify:FL=1